MFSECNGYSPVTQDFIWLGEYVDGTYLAEFDLITKEENSFYSIQKNKLIRFGLIGHGLKLFFEADGIFKLTGRMIEVIYSTPEKDYPLTGNIRTDYNDIITFKDAVSSGLANFSPQSLVEGGALSNTIRKYSFGYKTILDIDGVKFNFKALCKIPFDSPVYMNFRLVADRELDGKIQIKVGGVVVNEFHSPLKPNKGGELNWLVQ
ncbi:hypothetical protein [Brevibacillus laterosporus]|uniref:hypothetical protein n=1 Tax=Brevibacillus laterosporus TaxID=1465 RepID=UPI003D1BB2A4